MASGTFVLASKGLLDKGCGDQCRVGTLYRWRRWTLSCSASHGPEIIRSSTAMAWSRRQHDVLSTKRLRACRWSAWLRLYLLYRNRSQILPANTAMASNSVCVPALCQSSVGLPTVIIHTDVMGGGLPGRVARPHPGGFGLTSVL